MREVIVIGAGPVGMLLAGDLARRGVDVEILERRADAAAGSRAIGIHPPVLAALEASGVTSRLLDGARRVHRGEARSRGRTIGVVRFDRLSTRFPFVATMPQAATEAALAVDAPPPLRGAQVLGVSDRGDRAVVRVAVGGRIVEHEARTVVVASGVGGRALVFRPDVARAHEYGDRYVMADVTVGERPDDEIAVVHLDGPGVLESFPLPEGRRRFVAWDAADGDASPEARGARLQAALAARGEHAAAARITTATGFGVRRFVAPRLRRGRVVVVGDAAHEVSPIGGQGMNLGLLDAVTLAPLLAGWALSGVAPEPELAHWEHRRVGSARTAARMAAVNTRLGRPRGAGGDAARRGAVGAMLSGPTGALFARAYAMGFDAEAR